jgi:hypothetical protein
MIKEDISNLGKYSKAKITAICDNCLNEKKTTMKLYTSYGYKAGVYLCRSCKMKKNNLEKYGVDNVFKLDSVKDKIKSSNQEKYGVDNVSQSDIIKDKIRVSNLEKYGVEHHMKNNNVLQKQKDSNLKKYGVENISSLDSVKEKKISTCLKNNDVEFIFLDKVFIENRRNNNLEKYGVESVLSSKEIRDKIKNTNLKRYGVRNPSMNKDISNKIKSSVLRTKHKQILDRGDILSIDSDNRMFEAFCNSCNNKFDISYFLYYKRRETNTEICTICNEIDKHQSGKEIKVFNFINDNYSGVIIQNHRILNKELDIYLPELNIAFEVNGLYWHSEIFKSKNYHKDKYDMCKSNNIQLIHLWEDNLDYNFEIIKSMILNKINMSIYKIWARKCIIKEVCDNNVIKEFLNKNHIQGYASSSVKVGLYHNEELVSLMTFKKSKDKYDLNRFCNKLNTSVVGGASRLLKYFNRNYSNKIFTFSDNSYSNGDLYKTLGFDIEYNLKPDYKYVQNNIRIHKFNFRNKDTSVLYRIYDAGKVKYYMRG